MLSLLAMVALGWLNAAHAQDMQPVGEVKDHPPPPSSKVRAPAAAAAAQQAGAGGGGGGDGELEQQLNGLEQENMQSLFNWAIANSDPETLKNMAAEAKETGGTGAAMGGLPDVETASKVQPGQRYTPEELELKRKHVKEALDVLNMSPTEQKVIKTLGDILRNESSAASEKVQALEELEELIEPIDNANDLHTLGSLEPTMACLSDPDDEVAAVGPCKLTLA